MDQLHFQPSKDAPSYNMPFLKLSLSQLALRTPAPSQENVKPSPNQPRFFLPKFLRKTQSTQLPIHLGEQGSVTYEPRQLTLPVANNVPLYPPGPIFRTVEHMKEPFPFILPASPTQSDPSVNERYKTLQLRKDSLSFQDLQALLPQKDGDKKISNSVVLLPSPMLSEMQIDQISGSYFTSPTSNDLQSLPDRPSEGSWTSEEHGLVSSYYDNSETQTCGQNILDTSRDSPTQTSPGVKQWHDTRRDIGIVCAPSSFLHYQRGPQCGRSMSCSTEADWLAGNMSERTMLEEWLCDLRPSDATASTQDEEDGDHDQMRATQVKVAGKPKVVTIPRPISLSATSTSVFQESQSADRPSTPARPCQEISVFSPDTPIKYNSGALNYAATSLRPAALTPHRHHGRSFVTPQRSSSTHSHSLRDSLEPSPTESQDVFAIDLSNYIATSPLLNPSPVFSTTSEAAAWSRWKKLEGILEIVSRAIDTFPNGMLLLDSPAILALRTPNSLDETHIDALQRIFPQSASLLLSALAALLIVDSYISGLGETCTSLRKLPNHCSPWNYGELAARSDECLLGIPIKARADLGIELPNVTDLEAYERALRRKADVVAACVRVYGQRLLEAIYGRFDEAIWRALKVLVETLERNQS